MTRLPFKIPVGRTKGCQSQASSGYVVLVVLIAAFIMILVLMSQLRHLGRSMTEHLFKGNLTFYCAASMKRPMDELIADFEKETGVTIEVQYGGSGTLLSQIRVAPKSADLYLAADMSYLAQGQESGHIAEILPLAWMQPVLAVPVGNPKNLSTLADLLNSDVRFGLANPDSAAIGRICQKVLEARGEWQSYQESAAVFKPTMPDLANDLRLGSLDVAILWDSTVHQYPDLQALPLPEFAGQSFQESIGVVSTCENPALALQFARFLQAKDRGAVTFTRHGFRAIGGDRWTPRPKLLLFAGAMLNRAVDQTIHEFSIREGVEITRVYNGCGILVGQMNAGAKPDAYFSCDQSFLDSVADQFTEAVQISENPIVLVTAKGNPHNLNSLADLIQPDLRIGLAHPEKSALGFLTRRLFKEAHLEHSLIAADVIKQEAPQGDLLVASMATGALDAIIVYKSNAIGQLDRLQIHPIDSALALARQPFAVAKNSPHAHTMNRLLDAISAVDVQQRFQELGFTWVK